MKKIIQVAVISVFLMISKSSFSVESSMDKLVTYLKDMKNFQAGFVQTLYDVKGVEIQRSKGLVYIQKPGKFRWDYQKPFQQLILSDGDKIWIHDVEMEQVTVKDAHQALGSAPAALLGSDKAIYESFQLRDMGQREGLSWIELLPKEKDAEFEKIYVGMNSEQVAVMELHDSLSHVTQIQFHHIDQNKKLDADLFKFVPPKNADILGQ